MRSRRDAKGFRYSGTPILAETVNAATAITIAAMPDSAKPMLRNAT